MRTAIILAVLLASPIAYARPINPLAEPTVEEGQEHLRKGRAAFALRRWDEAIKEWEAGAGISTELACWYWNLGQAHRLAEHPSDAISAYERFIALAGNHPAAAKRVGFARGFVEDARRSLVAAQRPPTDLDDEPPSPAVRAVLPSPAAARWYEDTLGWSLAAGAVALSGVGLGLQISAGGLRDDASKAATDREHYATLDRADARSLTGTLVLVGAGVVGVSAVLRLVLVPEAVHVEAGPKYVGLRASF